MSPNKKKAIGKSVIRLPVTACSPGFSFSVILFASFFVCLNSAGIPIAAAQDSVVPLTPVRFEGYPNAPVFSVVSRKNELFFYPCDQCHETIEPNAEIRTLNAAHDVELEHGRGRIWCLSCHDLDSRDNLKTLLDELVDFDEANLVCGGCHANRHKDWVFGVHGKRVENWQGDRTLYDCAHCHNPHNPLIEPRAPSAVPPVRAGLGHTRSADHDVETAPDTGEEADQ